MSRKYIYLFIYFYWKFSKEKKKFKITRYSGDKRNANIL